MSRWSDWAFYAGIASLLATIVLTFFWPEFERLKWALVIGGAVLIVVSALPWLRNLKTTLTGRTARHGLHAVLTILFVLGIVGFVEALSYRHSKSFDLTENRRHSLSPQTVQLLRSLKMDVKALGFFRPDQPGKRVADSLLEQYARASNGRFKWEVVDLDLGPKLAAQYGVEAYGTIVLEAGGKHEKVLSVEEEPITNALVKVTREGKRVVYVLQGHGEPDLGNSERTGLSVAKTAMERASYEVKPLVLARETKIPDDAAVVIVSGPRTDLLPPEVDALDGYLGRGGKLLIMVDSGLVTPVQATVLKGYLAKYGVTLGDDLVIETNPIGRLFGLGPEVPIVQQYESHPITRDMTGIMTAFPITRSVEPAKTPPAGVTVQPLAKTSPASWGETNRDELLRGQVQRDDKDVNGPVTVAAVATKDKARLVVFGSSGIAANTGLGFQGNRDLFLNAVSWLAEEENQISIRPKESAQTPVFLTSQQAQAVFLLPVIVLPGIVVAGGIIAVARRRSAT